MEEVREIRGQEAVEKSFDLIFGAAPGGNKEH
jgi:hypothetical protein